MIIVNVSGGKDSQACLKMAVKERGSENVIGLFNDTQWEHPLTYGHIATMRDLYDVKIVTISAGSVPDQVRKYKRFPDGKSRFCTDNLKIQPSKAFLKEFAKTNKGVEVWLGVRSDESHQREKRYAAFDPEKRYYPHQVMPSKYPRYLGLKLGIRIRLPILHWSTAQVLEYLDGQENPLYRQGFDRVGCFPCLVGGDRSKEKAFFHDEFGENQFRIVAKLGQEIGRSVWTSKGCSRKYTEELTACDICSI